MTDEEGLFQGGEQGRAFGRILDLFKGGGVHDTIDKELNYAEVGGMDPNMVGAVGETDWAPEMQNIRAGFSEPSRFNEIMSAAAPEIADLFQGLSDEDKRMGLRGYSNIANQASRVDDVMRAILGNQWGDRDTYYWPDYHGEDMQRIMNVDLSHEAPMDETRLTPQNITDIIQYINRLQELQKAR